MGDGRCIHFVVVVPYRIKSFEISNIWGHQSCTWVSFSVLATTQPLGLMHGGGSPWSILVSKRSFEDVGTRTKGQGSGLAAEAVPWGQRGQCKSAVREVETLTQTPSITTRGKWQTRFIAKDSRKANPLDPRVKAMVEALPRNERLCGCCNAL